MNKSTFMHFYDQIQRMVLSGINMNSIFLDFLIIMKGAREEKKIAPWYVHQGGDDKQNLNKKL